MTADPAPYDICVIGGGINGAGIARDAAGRGLRVLLLEKGDLAGATSSASTKLIHGGLRYLEHGDLRLVRESLAEREVLLATAPNLVRPLQIILPVGPGSRPAWMIRTGLFLYDRLGGHSSLPRSKTARFAGTPFGEPLGEGIRSGLTYWDAWTDDARLVVLSALDAAERGADIRPRTRALSARRSGGVWRIEAEDQHGRWRAEARVLVNAAGPWVDHVLDDLGIEAGVRRHTRLVRGSHIVLPRLYEGAHAYLVQNPDRRVVFIIPFETGFTLVGTTEVDVGSAEDAQPSADEVGYLCETVSRHFREPAHADDVVWRFGGIRPLYDDNKESASAVTRDYLLDVKTAEDVAPVLTVYGGKITTFRRLAEHALEKLGPWLPGLRPAWTARAHLPGSDLPAGAAAWRADMRSAYGTFSPALIDRLSTAYGTRIERVLDGVSSEADLGRDFGGGLYAAEVDYLCANEWAVTAEDILWRRTKRGLYVDAAAAERLSAYLGSRGQAARAS
ncbi:MAG: glycerol-3-phosphate dehydrogenase [Proteobacteria bacterium]|nr:glycerol-3-phosphate dehydrogenase [Pseudomonadota bacterium]